MTDLAKKLSKNAKSGNGVEIVKGRGPYIGTYLRGRFYPLDPKPEEIFIEDISHALSNLTRFNGHTDRFYSVAEHSVYVSQQCPTLEGKRWGLLHDATEAYIGDMVRPLKSVIPEFKKIEDGIHKAVAKKFGLPEEIPEEVHVADNTMCSTEKRDIKPGGEDWCDMPEPYDNLRVPPHDIPPYEAKYLFMKRFQLLFGEQK